MSDSRTRIWFSLFVLAVFCAGGAGGFILGRHPPPRLDFAGPPDGGPGPADPAFARGRGADPGRGDLPFARGPRGGLPPEAAGRLAAQLQLDDTQRAQLRKVLDDHRAKFEEVHRAARDSFDDEQRELFASIRALLRPDQIQRFDQFVNGRRP